MSMTRTIKRNIAKENGKFVAQKPLREKGSRSFMEIIMGNQRLNKMLKLAKAEKEAK